MLVKYPAASDALALAVQAYLHETLGVNAQVRPWSGTPALPYFLQDAFDIFELQLRDKSIVMAGARKPRLPPLRGLRAQLDKLAQITERSVVFGTGVLASYERRRLVELKIPFVVPGNQLYLPDLGIDFREYFRRPRDNVSALTPATQALFIAALLGQEWQGVWQPASLILALGYTTMTLTRAVRELTGVGLVTVQRERGARRLEVNHPPAQAWEHATPYLRNPVKQTHWVDRNVDLHFEAPIAGLSALALQTLLSEPSEGTRAVSAAQWRHAMAAGIRRELVPSATAECWQVWSYPPNLLNGGAVVDPLSLSLSLKEAPDERVQQALDELRGKFPW